MPERLRRKLPYLAHYPVLAGHPGKPEMHNTLRRDHYWSRTASNVLLTLRSFQGCTRRCETSFKSQKRSNLSLVAGLLQLGAIDVLASLKEVERGSISIPVITDLLTNWAGCTGLPKAIDSTAASSCVKYFVHANGAPKYILTKNGRQFFVSLFESVFEMLCFKQCFTTACQLQRSRRTELFSRTNVQRLRQHTRENQMD